MRNRYEYLVNTAKDFITLKNKGFYFSKPVPATVFEEYLEAGGACLKDRIPLRSFSPRVLPDKGLHLPLI